VLQLDDILSALLPSFLFQFSFILVVSNGLCLKYEPNSWQKTSTALWRLLSSIEQSINHREKSKISYQTLCTSLKLSTYFSPTPPVFDWRWQAHRNSHNKKTRTRRFVKSTAHTHSLMPSSQQRSSYFFHRLLCFISSSPLVHVEWRFPLDFAPSPLVFHLIPFRESLIHQTLSVITHQTEKKQPCESLSLLVYGPIFIY
jgi:hypothetical protein